MHEERSPEVNALFDLLEDVLKGNNVSPNKYAVFGSGPLGIRGWYVINDVDVIVTKDQFEALAAVHGWEPHEHGIRRIMLHDGKIEILDGWHPTVAPLEQLIAEAEEIEKFNFVTLHWVVEWKKKRGKPKDADHLQIIATKSQNCTTQCPSG